MNTEIVFFLLCLLAMSLCRCIPINKNDVVDIPLNEIDDLKRMNSTILNTRTPPSSNEVSASILVDDALDVSTQVNNYITEDDTGNLMKAGDDARVTNSAADEHEEHAESLAILANFKLDQVDILVNNLIKPWPIPLNEHPTSEVVDGGCNMNVSQLTSDLWKAVTAVCLIENVTETTVTIGGCCHGNSHVGEKFRQMVCFLEKNVFRFLIKDSQIETVKPGCFGSTANVFSVVGQITKTLQETKQLITAITSGQCAIIS